MLSTLRNLDLDRLDMEEAVYLLALSKLIRAEYESLDADVPFWIDNRIRELKREVRERVTASVEKSIRDKAARLESLLPASERRARLEAELRVLEEAKAKLQETVG